MKLSIPRRIAVVKYLGTFNFMYDMCSCTVDRRKNDKCYDL